MDTFDEIKFHKNRIAFFIFNNEIKYLFNSKLSHKNWAKTLGIDESDFKNLARGYYYNNELRFYVGEYFETNENLENAAIKYYPKIVAKLNLENPKLTVGCIVNNKKEIYNPVKELAVTDKMKTEIVKFQLKSYSPYDATEKENVKQTLKFLTNFDNCFVRENLYGHFTSGAMIINKNKQVLLDYHKKLNMWLQFGGHCDGETNLLKNAFKEIYEETGLTDVTLISNGIFDVNVVNAYGGKDGKNHYHFDINYLFYANNDKFVVSNESKELKWCSIIEAFKLVDKSDVGLVRMLNKIKDIIGEYK